MISFTKGPRKTLTRFISALLVSTLLITSSEVALAAEIFTERSSSATRAPPSRFSPPVRIVQELDGEYKIIEEPRDRSLLTNGFKEDVGFIYLNYFIGQALY